MDPNSLLMLSIFTAFMVSPNGSTNNTVLMAYYKQSGLESEMREIERKRVSQEVRVYLGNIAFISKTIIERRVVFQWTF